jgi:hypothetical protein
LGLLLHVKYIKMKKKNKIGWSNWEICEKKENCPALPQSPLVIKMYYDSFDCAKTTETEPLTVYYEKN